MGVQEPSAFCGRTVTHARAHTQATDGLDLEAKSACVPGCLRAWLRWLVYYLGVKQVALLVTSIADYSTLWKCQGPEDDEIEYCPVQFSAVQYNVVQSHVELVRKMGRGFDALL